MAARKDKEARRMKLGHYTKDAFYFLLDLHGSLLKHKVSNFSQSDARYAQRLIEELDEIRPHLQKLANNLEANMPDEFINNWKNVK
tara:strand:+ start:2787 stop:3044 length:258 start_codon:yes stop_codon:yes gene_type:complete